MSRKAAKTVRTANQRLICWENPQAAGHSLETHCFFLFLSFYVSIFISFCLSACLGLILPLYHHLPVIASRPICGCQILISSPLVASLKIPPNGQQVFEPVRSPLGHMPPGLLSCQPSSYAHSSPTYRVSTMVPVPNRILHEAPESECWSSAGR